VSDFLAKDKKQQKDPHSEKRTLKHFRVLTTYLNVSEVEDFAFHHEFSFFTQTFQSIISGDLYV